MADRGLRLADTGRSWYEFEESAQRMRYAVEFVGHLSRERAEDYRRFLEDAGYRVFVKNINLNWNVGKVEYRPWADKGGRLASSRTTYNRELFLVEKPDDGTPFRLHTTYEDKISYYRAMRRPWLFLLLVFGAMGAAMRAPAALFFAGLGLAGSVYVSVQLGGLKRAAKTEEW